MSLLQYIWTAFQFLTVTQKSTKLTSAGCCSSYAATICTQNAKSRPSGLTNSHTLNMSSSKAPSQQNHKQLMPSRIGRCQNPKKSCRLFLDWLIITPNSFGTLQHLWHPCTNLVQKCSVAVDSRTQRIHYSLKKCTLFCASTANARFQQSILD